MKKKLPLIISLATIIAAVAILIKMYTLEVDVSLITTFKIPELSQISGLKPGDFREKAVSLDGKIIQETSKNQHPTASTAKMILGLAIMDKKPFSEGEKAKRLPLPQNFMINTSGIALTMVPPHQLLLGRKSVSMMLLLQFF